MKQTFKLTSFALMAILAIFAGCEKGDPGPAGTNGVDGTNGTNGEGFDEAVANGGITVYLDGTRPDEEPYRDTLYFKFAPPDLDYSRAYLYDGEDDVYFYLRRYTGMDFYIDYYEDYDDNFFDFEMERYEDVETGEEYWLDLELRADIATEDFQYFQEQEYMYNGDGQNFENDEITNYGYDPETGHFTVDISLTIPSEYSYNGYDLDVVIKVDATVYQNLNDGRVGGRQAGNAKVLPRNLKLKFH